MAHNLAWTVVTLCFVVMEIGRRVGLQWYVWIGAVVGAWLFTYLIVPAHAAKADDYGSERFVQVNQCMVDFLQHNPGKTDPQGITLSVCMKNHDYTFLPDAKIFGDSGPKCKNDKLGVFHSWCWSKQ